MEGKQYELAASLAEKYYDFEILIQLCEVSDNTDRIEKYLRQFSDKVSLLLEKFWEVMFYKHKTLGCIFFFGGKQLPLIKIKYIPKCHSNMYENRCIQKYANFKSTLNCLKEVDMKKIIVA